MTAARFLNALRIMRNLGATDLKAAGVVDENWGLPEASNRDQVSAFMSDPFMEAMRMPDATVEKLFGLIESRQPDKELSADRIEAVARAIFERRRSQELGWRHWSLLPEDTREKWRDAAREAIREVGESS